MTQKQAGLWAQLQQWFGGGAATRTAPESVVTWLSLPPYDIPGMAVVSGLLVENGGSEAAEFVHISLDFEGEQYITHMQVISDDTYTMEGGTPRDSYVTLHLPRLRAGGKVIVYVAGHSDESPKIAVHSGR